MLTEVITALFLVAICLVIHSTGIVVLGLSMARRRQAMARHAGSLQSAVVLNTIFATLTLLHLAENCIWAAFYYWQGLIPNYETALYFSLSTYTTIGYGDVLLPERWRLLGALEGIAGVLLCGLSTAFLFTVVNALFQFRMQRLKLSDSTNPSRPPN